MITAIVSQRGQGLLILGLSRANTTRLHQDQPILIDLDELVTAANGVHIARIAVVAGETEDAIAAGLRHLSGYDDAERAGRLR